MAISSSVNPYSSYTSASICLSVASAFGVPLQHGPDVRRPLGRELFVLVQHTLNQRHHPVVPRAVGGGGEVDGADGELLIVWWVNELAADLGFVIQPALVAVQVGAEAGDEVKDGCRCWHGWTFV